MPPTLNFPTEIQINNIAPGSFGSGDGGGLPKVTGSINLRIDNDSSGVFSIASLETQALGRDPDAPPHSPLVWQTVMSVDGAGPISINQREALLVIANFACPTSPQQETFNAIASVVLENAASPSLQIPLEATVLVEGLDITLVKGPDSFLAGATEEFTFRLSSSFRSTLNGSFSCESTNPPRFSSNTITPIVPALGAVEVTLSVTCAAGTPVGNYPVNFVFRQQDAEDRLDLSSPISPSFSSKGPPPVASLLTTQKVIGVRSVTVTSDLPSDLTIQNGSSTPCQIQATVSDGPATFGIETTSLPAEILGINPQRVAVNGSVVLNVEIATDGLLDLTGKLSTPLVLEWFVPPDEFHPQEVTGTLTFNITIAPVTRTFSAAGPIMAGEVQVSNASASFASDGGWRLSGTAHDFSTFFGDNFIFGFGFNFTDGAAHGPAVTGELGSSATSNPETLTIGKIGNDPWLVTNWKQAFAGGGFFRLHVGGDFDQLLSDLGDDFKALFKSFEAGPDCPENPDTGEPDCPEPGTDDFPGGDGGEDGG